MGIFESEQMKKQDKHGTLKFPLFCWLWLILKLPFYGTARRVLDYLVDWGMMEDRRGFWLLLVSLRHWNLNTRILAAECLERRAGDTRAIEPLVRSLSDRSYFVRRAATRALAKFNEPQAVKALMGSLKDIDAGVRAYATHGLGNMHTPETMTSLGQMIKDESSWVRGEAAEALGKIGDSSAVPLLTEALADIDENVRRKAVWALRENCDPRTAEALASLLEDKKALVRDTVADVLEKLGWQPSNSRQRAFYAVATGNYDAVIEEGPTAVEPLHQVLDDPDMDLDTRQEVVSVLKEIAHKYNLVGLDKELGASGSMNCTRCTEGLQWWSRKTISRSGIDVVKTGRRPNDFAGACRNCRDGFCKIHANGTRCPVCGSTLID